MTAAASRRFQNEFDSGLKIWSKFSKAAPLTSEAGSYEAEGPERCHVANEKEGHRVCGTPPFVSTIVRQLAEASIASCAVVTSTSIFCGFASSLIGMLTIRTPLS